MRIVFPNIVVLFIVFSPSTELDTQVLLFLLMSNYLLKRSCLKVGIDFETAPLYISNAA